MTKQKSVTQKKVDPRRQFVVDVVKSAVALPQADPQDRLRVLTSAANVIAPMDAAMARKFAAEGMRIESDLIVRGERPVISMLANGHVDCASVVQFVENVPPAQVAAAEQSLVGVVSSCSKQGLEPVRRKLDIALEQGAIAPRALMAVIDTVGPRTTWSQSAFERMFASLPSDPNSVRDEAPNYAAMFNRMAPEVDRDVAKKTGLKFLEWLGKLEEGGNRNIAINLTNDTLQQVLGKEDYEAALASNVMARQVAQTAGQAAEVEHPEEDSVSVLGAIGAVGTDQTDALNGMPVSTKAREAAAHGFATGTAGDRRTADRYFDIAFDSANAVWNDRAKIKDAPAVIEEVSEAAAQVDAVSALKRAQSLTDPSAQAIGMVAVARVVVGQNDSPVSRPDGRQPAPATGAVIK